jgi:hypothetical protein
MRLASLRNGKCQTRPFQEFGFPLVFQRLLNYAIAGDENAVASSRDLFFCLIEVQSIYYHVYYGVAGLKDLHIPDISLCYYQIE